MRRPLVRVGCLFLFFAILSGASEAKVPFKTAKFSQVVNQVEIVREGGNTRKAAALNDLLNAPEGVRTGPKSRAELIFPDETVTRVGANTVMTFSSQEREVNLQQGTVIFHSPQGKGGGVIKTAAATAAVTGTTITCMTTSNGGFKLMVLEGKARATLPNGKRRTLQAGQMTFVVPGRQNLGPVLEFDLGRNVQGSRLIKGFKKEMPSMKKIERSVFKQEREFKRGRAESTDLEVGDAKTSEGFRVRIAPDVLEQNADQNDGGDGFDKDVTIISPSIDSGRVLSFREFADRFLEQDTADDVTDDVPEFGPGTGPKFVFPAGRITFSTPDVNLGPWGGASAFAFAGRDEIIFRPFNLRITGFDGVVGFFSLGDIRNETGGGIFHAGDAIAFGSDRQLDFDDFTISNPGGDVFGFGQNKVDITNSKIEATRLIKFDSDGDILLTDTIIKAPLGRVDKFELETLDGGWIDLKYTQSQTLRAAQTNMAAHTIVLTNVIFPYGATATFYTMTGNYNIDQSNVVPGALNFFNVKNTPTPGGIPTNFTPGTGMSGNINGDPNFRSDKLSNYQP